MKASLLITALAGITLAGSANAAVLASYEFDNTGTTNDNYAANSTWFEADSAAANLTAGDFLSGPGVNPIVVAATDVMFAAEGQSMNDGVHADDNATFLAQTEIAHTTHGDYFTVTLTADGGFALDLENMTFDVTRANNGTNDYVIRTSVDGFTGNVAEGNGAISTTTSNQDIDFSDSAFDNLSSIEIRIVFDDRQNNSGTSSATFIDNVIINGEVVPEPGSLALLGLGGLMMIKRRRHA